MIKEPSVWQQVVLRLGKTAGSCSIYYCEDALYIRWINNNLVDILLDIMKARVKHGKPRSHVTPHHQTVTNLFGCDYIIRVQVSIQ